MNELICEVLKGRIDRPKMFDRLGGLVHAQPVQMESGLQVLPIGCYEDGQPDKMLHFVPDTQRGPVGFFMDPNGAQIQKVYGEKGGRLEMVFNLNFLGWYSIQETDLPGCSASHVVAPRLMRELMQAGENDSAFLNQRGFSNMLVTGVSVMPKTPALFQSFSFYQEGLKNGLFAYPYDYVGLVIRGKYDVTVKAGCFDDGALPNIFQLCCK